MSEAIPGADRLSDARGALDVASVGDPRAVPGDRAAEVPVTATSAARLSRTRHVPPAVWRLLAVLSIALGISLMAAAYATNSQTYDEGNHVEAGLEWLERGKFEVEPKHPPLTRVAVAVGPYLAGVRLSPEWQNLRPWLWEEGDRVLFRGPGYRTTMTLARLGNLPFYFLLALVVWLWARALLGAPGAAAATGFVALAPPILGHASLATTDIGVAATLALTIWCLVRWLDLPTVGRAAAVGGAAALALTSKFTTIPYLGLSIVFLVAWRLLQARLTSAAKAPASGASEDGHASAPVVFVSRVWARAGARQLLSAAAAFGLVVWAVYRFSIVDLHGVPVPAGELLKGIKDAVGHNASGHESYLLGEWSHRGWWYYFPVALAVKTPLVLIAFGCVGAASMVRAWRADWRTLTPLLLVAAIFATGFITRVNIGVRHVLPFYAGWAVLAGAGVLALWRARAPRRAGRAVVVLMLAWFVGDVVRETPHHLAYFNELSRRDPGHLLVDSNLDWGQDMLRLAAEIDRRRITELSVMLHSRPVMQQLTSARVLKLERGRPASGWVAVSETCLRNRGDFAEYCGDLQWLDAYRPVARVGRSIRLYHVP